MHLDKSMRFSMPSSGSKKCYAKKGSKKAAFNKSFNKQNKNYDWHNEDDFDWHTPNED